MVNVNKRGSALAALFTSLSVAVGGLLHNNDADAAGDPVAEITEEAPVSRECPCVEVITEQHNNYSGPSYARSLVDSCKLGEKSVYMVEMPLVANGVLKAFHNDEISQETLVKFLEGLSFPFLAHTSENKAATIAKFKEAVYALTLMIVDRQ